MKLLEVIEQNNLEVIESKSILEKFGEYENIAKEWETKAKQIIVTDASQTTEMAMAREARKKFSQLRIDIEKARKEMKEQSLRKGQAIDAVAKFLKSLVEPIEEHLRQQEDFVKIQEQNRLLAEKIENERLLELERLAKEKEEREEQERIKKENEKLRLEIAKKERKIQEQEESNKKIQEKQVKEIETLKVVLTKAIICPHCKKSFELEEGKL